MTPEIISLQAEVELMFIILYIREYKVQHYGL